MKKLIKKRALIFSALLLVCIANSAQQGHPRIYVTDSKREAFLKRMNSSVTVMKTVERIKAQVDPYVNRHQTDPEWIVSRLQMYWNNKYTKVYVNGMYFSHGEGKAPVPTVRYSGSRDWATDYRIPAIEDIKPYMDDERGIWLQNNVKEGNPWEWVKPEKTGNIIENMNASILNLVEQASFIYWITGEEKYAVFASDIFMKYIDGLYYRDPPLTEGDNRNENVLGLQTFEVIHEKVIEQITVGYDFIYPYLKKKGQNISEINDVFRKWADQEIKNGVPDNNWNLMQARFITYLALALENDEYYTDKKGTQYYIDQVLNQNSIRQKALKDVALIFDQQNGIWPEASGYSMGVSRDILETCCLIDNVQNNHILNQFPIIEKAVLATFQYLMPNDFTVAWGDSHYSRLRIAGLEMLISQYRKYGETKKEEMLTEQIHKFIDIKEYNRTDNQSLFQLFFYVDDLMKTPASADKDNNLITNTFYSPNVSWFVQRNGFDIDNGMMISENASLGNHSHTNGINVELYGKGMVFAPDCAAGVSYWSVDHRDYYARFPAHNTVIVDGKSDYGNMRGKLSFNLISSYPPSGEPGELKGYVTFSDVSFLEPATESEQNRFLSLVRTGPSTGYFIDIFRSHRKDGKDVKNEYIYHSQGQKIDIQDQGGATLKSVVTSELSTASGDQPGYDYFTDKRVLLYEKDFRSLFTINSGTGKDVMVNMWMKGFPGRKVFSVLAPKSNALSGSVSDLLLNKPLPSLIVRQNGQAWSKPFLSIIDPYFTKDGADVKKVEYFANDSKDDTFVGINVTSANSRDMIFNGASEKDSYRTENINFTGRFALVRYLEAQPGYLFLGEGQLIQCGDISIENSEAGNSVSIELLKESMKITSEKKFRLIIPVKRFHIIKGVLKVVSGSANESYTGKIISSGKGSTAIFDLPSMQNATLSVY